MRVVPATFEDNNTHLTASGKYPAYSRDSTEGRTPCKDLNALSRFRPDQRARPLGAVSARGRAARWWRAPVGRRGAAAWRKRLQAFAAAPVKGAVRFPPVRALVARTWMGFPPAGVPFGRGRHSKGGPWENQGGGNSMPDIDRRANILRFGGLGIFLATPTTTLLRGPSTSTSGAPHKWSRWRAPWPSIARRVSTA